MQQSDDPAPVRQLSGVFDCFELAIIQAIHILGEASDYHDGTVRARDIFQLVRNASIRIDGKPTHGPHRSPLFVSALSGRRSSFRIFEQIKDPKRSGAWWRLRVPYQEAIDLARDVHIRPRPRSHEDEPGDDRARQFAEQPESPLPRREDVVRARLFSVLPLALEVHELDREVQRLEMEVAIVQQDLHTAYLRADPLTLRALDRYKGLQRQLDQAGGGRFNL
jgi:hypothetical protein